jgi:hypothetical protein
MNDNKALSNFSVAYLKEIFKAQPAVVITVIYLYFSTIGLIYAISFFNVFKIDVVSFFSLQDFLLITISNPQVLIYGLIVFLLFLILKTRIYSGLNKTLLNPPVFKNKILNLVLKPIFALSKILSYPFINYKIMIIFVFISTLFISFSSSQFQAKLLLNEKTTLTLPDKYFNKSFNAFIWAIMGFAPKHYETVRLCFDSSKNDTNNTLDGEYIILIATNNYLIIFKPCNKNVYSVLRNKVAIISYSNFK